MANITTILPMFGTLATKYEVGQKIDKVTSEDGKIPKFTSDGNIEASGL